MPYAFCITFSLALIVSLPHNAHAYLDPGTGSYLFQILTAVFIGAIFSVKIFFKNIRDFIGGIFKTGQNESHKQ